MFKSCVIAASALLVASSAAAAPASKPASPQKTANPQKETVYCLTYEKTTGSRISQSECKTKKEWARDRVDVDELLKG